MRHNGEVRRDVTTPGKNIYLERVLMKDTNRFAQAVEITTATYDQVAADYARHHEEMRPHWADRLEQFVDLLGEEADRLPLPNLGVPEAEVSLAEFLQFLPVLDAGCGTGRDTRALAAHDLPVLGIDLSWGMLEEARARTARRLPRGAIHYALSDLRRLELPDASCRGIWCSASLLHIPHHVAPRAVAELARVARPGAPAVIFLKRREDQSQEQFLDYEQDGVVAGRRFYAYYTREEARELIGSGGFTIAEEAVVPDGRPSAPDWISLVARKP
jgi:SAM-dependent methyltransferase